MTTSNITETPETAREMADKLVLELAEDFCALLWKLYFCKTPEGEFNEVLARRIANKAFKIGLKQAVLERYEVQNFSSKK